MCDDAGDHTFYSADQWVLICVANVDFGTPRKCWYVLTNYGDGAIHILVMQILWKEIHVVIPFTRWSDWLEPAATLVGAVHSNPHGNHCLEGGNLWLH